MDNLTDEQVTAWKDSISSILDSFKTNIENITKNCATISNTVKSNDPSLANSWSNLEETISTSNTKLAKNRTVFDDTLSTFVKSIQAINQEMVSTVDLADNDFKGFIDRINAI